MNRIRFFVSVVFILGFGVAMADNHVLVPIYTPHPQYTSELLKAKISGEVLVDLTIHSQGNVESVNVINATHLELQSLVLGVLSTWQFKPWAVENDKLPIVTVRMPFNFSTIKSRDEFSSVPLDINTALLKMKCTDVNKSFLKWNKDYRDTALSRMKIFWHTQGYLNKGFMIYNATEPERKILLASLRSNINRIISDCRKNPEAMYVDYLPEEIRKFL